MRLKFLIVVAMLAVLCWAGSAVALTIALNSEFSNFSPPLSVDFGTVTIEDIGNDVKFTITYNPATGSGGANADLQDFYFNINPNPSPLSNLAITGTDVQGVTFTQKADGDGTFDYQVNFGNGAPILQTTSFIAHLEGTNLSVANFADFTSDTMSAITPGNGTTWTVAAHFQNTTLPAGSDFVGGNPVPIPPSALLLGSGLLGLVGLGWRRRKG